MTRQELIGFCLSFPGAYEDYPYDSIGKPGTVAVMRHSANKKSFAAVYERNGRLCVTLKYDPLAADFLRQTYRDVEAQKMPAWNFVYVGGDVPEEELQRMIGNSYDLIKPKQKGRGQTCRKILSEIKE